MAGKCDLPAIKTAIQTLLSNANTTTASPIDLSDGLTRRVKKVCTLNLEAIPIQASFWPFVTVFISQKQYENQSIGPSSLNMRRDSYVTLDIAGGIWDMRQQNPQDDVAQEQIEDLMENVELIMRSDDSLNGNVEWLMFEGTTYHAMRLNEEAHARVGVMTIRARVNY